MTSITTPTRVPLRGIPLLKATRALLRHPSTMAAKTGLVEAVYDQADPGNGEVCETRACVGGWIAFLAGEWDGKDRSGVRPEVIQDLTGLSWYLATNLYYGRWTRWGEPDGELRLDRSNAAAVRVLGKIIQEMESGARSATFPH